ncbi:MAG: dihydropteroate synthase [Clostridiales bacterium]|nr:dihydropteroate synthase [Clostridiales bacterium]
MMQLKLDRKDTGRTLIMGILNCTPDSFSDGGKFLSPDKAVAHALEMTAEGADIIDIGGESTRPGYTPVDEAEESARVIPVISELSGKGIVTSVDTTKISVAKVAIENGCCILNDIGGDLKSSQMAETAAYNGAYLVIMFNCRVNGPCEGSVISRAREEIGWNIEYALSKGVSGDKIIIDPGIGFGTTREQDIELTAGLKALDFGYPLLYAASRKRIVGDIYDCGDDLALKDRCSDALALTAVTRGASIIRSHGIRELKAQLAVADRFMEA